MRSFVITAIGTYAMGVVHAQKCHSVANKILGNGEDIGHKGGFDSPDACCAYCNTTSACVAWTFHDAGLSKGDCWLHSGAGDETDRSGVTSGMRDGPLPPTPPPTPTPGWDACTGSFASLPFCDTSKSIDTRLKDLVARVSTADAGKQLTARESPAMGAIGVPAYYWGTNAIHGVQNVGCLKTGQCPTSFPAPCALSAAFNRTVARNLGMVIGRELRAYNNAQVHNSLDTWSPTININRDPRWGRNVESPGEDPYTAGQYGAAYTDGLQNGVDKSVRQATVTLKHWVAYSVESYHGTTRHNYDANVSAYDLASTYFPGWETVIKSGAKGVMCSYNMLNGKPTCGNKELTDTLRVDWGFTGYVTSDSDSCADIYRSKPSGHGYEKSAEEAVRDCLVSGTDIDSGGTYSGHLANAVSMGVANRSLVDSALYNSYKMRFEMGLFDPNVPNKYRDISTNEVGSTPYQAMSLDAARQGMTLLKNDNSLLPFKAGQKVAVIGRAVNDANSYTGNYDGPLCPKGGASCWPSLCSAVAAFSSSTPTCVETDSKQAVAAAGAADIVIFLADNAKDGGGEGHDRDSIALAADQKALALAVLAANKNTALVLVNGGAISIDDLKDTAPAILEAWMPGVHGADAMAQTLFGANNPGGKLPVTIYHSNYTSEVEMVDMSMTAGPGRSYRYYTGTPMWPFGFGLSYTTFELVWTPKPPASTVVSHIDGSATRYSVVVKNTGAIAGDEVVLAFMKPVASSFTTLGKGTPVELKRLFDFQKVHLAPGASTTLEFAVPIAALHMVDGDGHTSLHNGEFEVVFSRGHGKELAATITVDVAVAPVRAKTLRKWW